MTRAAVLLGASLLLSARAARADNVAAKERARALLREGNALLGQDDATGALEKFQQAYSIYPSPKVLANIGTALRGVGRDVEAAAAYERCLHESAGMLTADLRAAVEKALADVRGTLGRTDVTVNEAGAMVVVDGVSVGASPLSAPVWMKPGAHRIEARKGGFHPTSETVEVVAGQTRSVRLLVARAVQQSEPARPSVSHAPVLVPTGSRAVGHDVAEKRPSAPPPWHRRWYVWAGAGAVAVAVVATTLAFSGGGNSSDSGGAGAGSGGAAEDTLDVPYP